VQKGRVIGLNRKISAFNLIAEVIQVADINGYWHNQKISYVGRFLIN